MNSSFRNPGSIYRGAPFWAWNNRLDAEQLKRQIDCFKEMGLGGFHMHPRTGMDTEYLSDEFFDMIKACRDHAEANDMLAWLYDEDRWPSGTAGGIVTKDERYRARHLLFTPRPYVDNERGEMAATATAGGCRTGQGRLLATYAVTLAEGCLASYRRLREGEKAEPGATLWYAYREVAMASTWFNNQAYVDTLSPEAMRRFIDVTHERYAREVGESFGKSIPAIFTDEPQFVHKQSLRRVLGDDAALLPWTDDLGATFMECYGGDVLDYVPELFWELPEGKASVWRYRYHDHVCERFTQAFSDQIGDWCEAHGIALTGHMMEECSLGSQTAALGESMRGYRSFQIPGIDVLCDATESEYATAKQAQSAAHQYGRSGVLSELYGVTNWGFDFAGHKRQGDWQAALGVTYRVHHLAMVSMAGEAKRDYPASISYQSPWYREYPVVEDHFARLNVALSDGKPHVRVGVIHPVESYWLCCGPVESTAVEREERDRNFSGLIKWLLYGFLDFDFISESLLPTQKNEPAHGGFAVGRMEYDAILVPGMRTIRSTTLARLEDFADAGGKVTFAGEIPSLVDAEASDAPAMLASRCECVTYSQSRIVTALEPVREVGLWDANGLQVGGCLHQLRRDEDGMTLFVCNTDRNHGKGGLMLRIRGAWQVSRLDTANGDERPVGAEYRDGMTLVPCELAAHGHQLLSLTPGRREQGDSLLPPAFRESSRLGGPVPVTLSEPNVLLLDKAEYRVDDGEWEPARHVLEIDPILRKTLGLPVVDGAMAQPWADKEPVEHAATVTVLFVFESRVPVVAPELALENVAHTKIVLDGVQVPATVTGYFTDEAIETVPLPDLAAGRHVLELHIDYSRKTYIEWCYLLGDFGVEVRGDRAVIIEPVKRLAFGDWTPQGLPFYAGNVTYHCTLPEGGTGMALRVPRFAGALVSLTRNGVRIPLAFAPHRSTLAEVTAGEAIDLTVFGNRANAFGQVHGLDFGWWYGPDAWRTTGDQWVDEYQLSKMGILSAPVLERSCS
ncbi:MAG: glycosyl hydrolase [Kiritimatiellia bacterium]|nr:glycosyl hydrolase [Kiritimatiellia bacterium]MDP6810912.1 glycosyl hydrolase [Kiritimatiellia bacterium]MDP7023370.1 glycosyl hydrolase [Kiritimatiellia bacterium]